MKQTQSHHFWHVYKKYLFLFIILLISISAFILITTNKQLSPEDLRCPLCNMTVLSTEVTSSKRDVILASAISEFKRVQYFIRTFRTTGSKARVILFIDEENKITDEMLYLMESCNIEPYYVKYPNNAIKAAPKQSRYYYEYQWLKDHINEVDRVLHTDSFDVIFQGDPFTPKISRSKLYFTLEPITIKKSSWTQSWVQQCYGIYRTKKIEDNPVSCSGVTLGGSRPYLDYLKVLLTSDRWSECYGHSLDQAHHNYLLYNGTFKDAGLEIHTMGCDSDYLTMHFCCKKLKCVLDDNGVMHGPGNSNPILVHQYNRWKNFTTRNNQICPNFFIPRGKLDQSFPKINFNSFRLPQATLQPPQ